MTELESHAAAVLDAQARCRDADNGLALAVLAMRGAGASWTDVGRTLGVSRQAAWERWHRLEATDTPH